MTLADLFTTKYSIKLICDNCGSKTIIKIPKGTRIDEHIRDEQAKCQFCGVAIKMEEKHE